MIIKVDSNPFLLNYHLETDFLELFYPNEFLSRQTSLAKYYYHDWTQQSLSTSKPVLVVFDKFYSKVQIFCAIYYEVSIVNLMEPKVEDIVAFMRINLGSYITLRNLRM